MTVTITCKTCDASVTNKDVTPAITWDQAHQRIHDRDWVLKQITPVLMDRYGRGRMARDLAAYLAQHIADRGLSERRVMQTCWYWFPGGDTAGEVAKEIVERLSDG